MEPSSITKLFSTLKASNNPTEILNLYSLLQKSSSSQLDKIEQALDVSNQKLQIYQNKIRSLNEKISKAQSEVLSLHQKKKEILDLENNFNKIMQIKLKEQQRDEGVGGGGGGGGGEAGRGAVGVEDDLPVSHHTQNGYLEWSPKMVMEWVKSLSDGKFDRYSKFFEESEVSGPQLNDITREDLRLIGVKSLSDNRELFEQIKLLREPSKPSSTLSNSNKINNDYDRPFMSQSVPNLNLQSVSPSSHSDQPSPSSPLLLFTLAVPGTGVTEKIQFKAETTTDFIKFSPLPSRYNATVFVELTNTKTLSFRAVEKDKQKRIVQVFPLPFEVSASNFILEGTTVLLNFQKPKDTRRERKTPRNQLEPTNPTTLIKSSQEEGKNKTTILTFILRGSKGGSQTVDISAVLDGKCCKFIPQIPVFDVTVVVELSDSRTVLFNCSYWEEEHEKRVVHVFNLGFDVTPRDFKLEASTVVLRVPKQGI